MSSRDVAITGMGVICAGAGDVEQFAALLRAGRSGIGPIESARFEPAKGAVAGEVRDTDLRRRLDLVPEAADAGLSRPAQLAVVAMAEALGQSGVDVVAAPDRVGLVVGRCQGDQAEPFRPLHHVIDEVAAFHGLAGFRMMLSTACAAGSNALGTARDKLWNGDADVVLAGGVETLNLSTYIGFTMMQAMCDGPCSPYSRSSGLSLGEGAAFFVLERLEDARRRGATVLAELRGYGLSADAYHATAPDPTGRGAANAMRRALRDAGLEPSDVDYVNGHGTGTPANDRMERKAMRGVFGERVGDVPISSTKSVVGHALGAAGAIELIACMIALVDDVLPPTVNFEEGAVADGFDFVPNRARPARTDVVVKNNYAFGGNNVSLALSKPRATGQGATAEGAAPVVVTGIGIVGLDDGAGFAGKLAALPLDGRGLASASDWRHMDAITRNGLAAVRLAIDDAGLPLDAAARDEVALIFGTSIGPVAATVNLVGRPGEVSVAGFAQAVMNAPPGKICQVVRLRGPTTTVTTGPLSGTLALSIGVDQLRSGAASAAVVVASDEALVAAGADDLLAMLTAFRTVRPRWSKVGRSRPYDADRDGVAFAQAAVALVLEPAAQADARQARIHAALLGVGHTGWPASGSVSDRLEAVLRGALGRAGVGADDVVYCAGAASGDAYDDLELEALGRVLPPGAALSAPKGVTGECESASGLLNVAAAAAALAGSPVVATASLGSPPAGPLRHVTASTAVASPGRGIALAVDAAPGTGLGAVVLGGGTAGA